MTEIKIGNYKLNKDDAGKINHSGSINLSDTAITALPDNLTVGGFLDLSGSAITALPDNLTVGGFIDLSGSAITALPDNLTIGVSLYLSDTAITALPDNLTVGGSLYLSDTAITALPDNLTVGGSLDLRGSAITALPDNLTVGGSLDLSGSAITALPDNLTVGGFLDLSGSAITALPDNLTVGGFLDLSDTAITALPDNLTVGVSLYLSNTAISNLDVSNFENKDTSFLSWENGKYIKTDGIFAEVISKKSKVWKLKKMVSKDVFYCVTDGNGRYSHGNSIAKAKEDLLYKISTDAKKELFSKMPVNTVLPFSKCVELYRAMTGACEFGVKQFIDNHNIENRDYSIAEIIEKTKGQYGSEMLVFNNDLLNSQSIIKKLNK